MFCTGCSSFKDSGLRCTCDVLLCATCYESHNCTKLAPWPHQPIGQDAVVADLKAGHKAVCMTTPTGGGKTFMVANIIRRVTDEFGWRVALFTNRRILTRQGTKTLVSEGIDHGIIAAGYPMDVQRRVQVVSSPTLASRISREKMDFPPFDLAIFDEAHRRDFDFIHEYCRKRTIARLGVTATPLNVGDLFDRLIIAGKNSELRACGALVPCDVFAPSEPDMRGVKMVRGEYVHKGMVQRVMQCLCFADVFDAWKAQNPWGTPTLVFAPGVPESKWFRDEFESRGVRAAHIDGETTEQEREDIFAAHKDGEIKVISSFGVLREGANLPWVDYGILVQVCGALSTYLQIVGRLLRAYPDKKKAILQDHAGAWWRHGSPNMDRAWELTQTDKQLAKERKIARQRGEILEGICCPKCHGIRMAGPKCPHCGFEHKRSVRPVRMLDGTLKKMVGEVIKPKVQPSQDERNWKSCLFAAARSGHTVRQAAGRFYKLTGRWPNGLANTPDHGSVDWNRRAGEVYPWLLRKRKAAQ